MNNGVQPILQFDSVTVDFDAGPVVEDVSFVVLPGECRVILGAAGSGKTVLLKTALGLVRPASGRVWLFGDDITNLSEERLFQIRARVGMLFQEGALFDSQTVEENVAYPLLSRISSPTRQQITDVEARVLESLKFVELGHTIEKYPSELSGGMRRRVGIARATVTEPPLVLYDSPTAGLDPITANTIMALVAKERDTRNTSTVIVTHRYQDGQLMANFRFDPRIGPNGESGGHLVPDDHTRVGHKTIFMVMRDGKLVFEGSQSELENSADPYLHKFVRR
ncbi:MAG TPA: ATP-binding cassette domain-containing protein [Bryobacteraceae bacterium]|jgi:phospholipid/cholesterol/gamma-HCH transport system ATP-binding protein